MTDFVDFDSDLSDDDISFASVAFPLGGIDSVHNASMDFKEDDSQTRPDHQSPAVSDMPTQSQWVKVRVPPKIPPCAENTVDFSYGQPIVQNCEKQSMSSKVSSEHKSELDEKSTQSNSLSFPLTSKACQKTLNCGRLRKVRGNENAAADSNARVSPSSKHVEKVRVPGSSLSHQLPPVESADTEDLPALPRVISPELRSVQIENIREEKINKVRGKTKSASKHTRVIRLGTQPFNSEPEGNKKRISSKRKRSESTLSYKRDFSYSRSHSRRTSSRSFRAKKRSSDKWNKDLYEGRSDSRDRSLTRSTRSSRSRSRSRSSRSRSRSITRSTSRSRVRASDDLDPKFLKEDLKPEHLDLSKYDQDGKKIFVGNLLAETTEHDLSDCFGKYGAITRCYIAKNRVIGFVVYRDVESALNAVRSCNLREVKLLGRNLRVSLAKARDSWGNKREPRRGRNRSRSSSRLRNRNRTRSRSYSQSQSDKKGDFEGRKIYVGRLPLSLREVELKELFAPYGEIRNCYMPRRGARADSQRNIGIGFVVFNTAEDAQRAIRAKNQTELQGRFIQVKLATRSSQLNNSRSSKYDQQGRKLHVGNLPTELIDRELKGMFIEFGDVEECYIPRSHDDERSMGYGFVVFKDARDAEAALRHWDGRILRGHRVRCQKAKPTDKRRPGFRDRRRN